MGKSRVSFTWILICESYDSQLVSLDVFGLWVAPSNGHSKSKEILEMQAQILALRKRLRSVSINEVLRPSKPSADLPTHDQVQKMFQQLQDIAADVAKLPQSVEDTSVDVELRSLRAEVDGSFESMKRIEKLANLCSALHLCDGALSDLLEHIDSYPACPLGELASAHRSAPTSLPNEQLSARLEFTRDMIGDMSSKFAPVADDKRAISERTRVLQTWSEIEEMAIDRLGGKKSRPGSVVSSRGSSGRNSSASVVQARGAKKMGTYSHLSAGSISSRGKHLSPATATPRRAVSGGSAQTPSRPLSQLSTLSNLSNRSTSGGLNMAIHGSTFASRQRTTSLTASPATLTPVRKPSGTPLRSRAQTGQSMRSESPSVSEISSQSRSTLGPSRSSSSMSTRTTWSRAPRNSLSSLLPPGVTPKKTPQKKAPLPRKTYVADPKSKLDVAVGDVVNKLPVGINIEGVSESWHDQSGKYWIGDQDPKLCFCRILRSQTVMVRVGGGWTELSK